MALLILASLGIMLASLAGVVAVWKQVGEVIERNLDYLVSLSAGVFLVFAYQLAGEAVEHVGALTQGLLWIFGGAIGIWLIFKIIPSLHHHGPEHGHHAHRAHLDPRRLMLSDAIHNTGDGIFLAASFAVSPVFGMWAAISVFVHEVLQEISEFFVLRDGGYTTKGALFINFITSSTVLIGAIGGYFLLDAFEMLEGPLLGIAAGGILVVVLHDLIPHSVREAVSTSHYVKHLLLFGIGCILMLGISTLVPHVE